MDTKFSGNEIIEMAIQIEKKGYAFYQTLVDMTKTENMKKIFEFLAGEEKKHIEVFENLRNEADRIFVEGPYDWDEVSLYFKALIDTKVFPETAIGEDLAQELEDEIGAIHIAISFEKDNILFFQEMQQLVTEEERKIIDDLINQEKGHIRKLVELKKQVGES